MVEDSVTLSQSVSITPVSYLSTRVLILALICMLEVKVWCGSGAAGGVVVVLMDAPVRPDESLD